MMLGAASDFGGLWLERMISEDEIQESFFSINVSKATRLDGFTESFYQITEMWWGK